MGDHYCTFVRHSQPWLRRRLQRALADGFAFVHPADADRLPLEEVAHAAP
jgi:hypothetical protein